MTDATRLKLSYFFTLTAILLLIVGLVTMFQTPRPEWSRGIVIPAAVLVIAGNVLRRRVRPRR
jgi:hypothetical protein